MDFVILFQYNFPFLLFFSTVLPVWFMLYFNCNFGSNFILIYGYKYKTKEIKIGPKPNLNHIYFILQETLTALVKTSA